MNATIEFKIVIKLVTKGGKQLNIGEGGFPNAALFWGSKF